MEEGVFGQWLKAPGEFVKAGEMVFLLEGEKAAHEIESFDSGYLCVPGDSPQPGTTVKVGEVIGFLLAEGEPSPTSVQVHQAVPINAQPGTKISTPRPEVSPSVTASRPAGPAARRLARELSVELESVFSLDPTGRVRSDDIHRAATLQPKPERGQAAFATPRARRRARELGVDWTCLTGTGRGGRIREQDVLSQSTLPVEPARLQEPTPTELGRHIPATKLRLAIAQRMTLGAHQAVPVTLTTKVDATALVALREQLKRDAASKVVPSFNDILTHWTAQTLSEQRDLNACWYRNGIYAYEAIHIAIAIDTPHGLLAPVVRNSDQITLMEIAEQTQQLIVQSRAGQLSQHQLTGGTFTISNLGMFGIDAFTPILNLPQAAILGIGRIVEEPVVRRGQLVAGQTLTLSLTFDHRVVDGAPAARWLQHLCQKIIHGS